MDTHSYTDVAMTLARGVDLDLCPRPNPRLKDLSDRHPGSRPNRISGIVGMGSPKTSAHRAAAASFVIPGSTRNPASPQRLSPGHVAPEKAAGPLTKSGMKKSVRSAMLRSHA